MTDNKTLLITTIICVTLVNIAAFAFLGLWGLVVTFMTGTLIVDIKDKL